MGMGWDEMGRVRSPQVDWCRVDPSRVVCVRGYGCGCVCTREEDLVRLAQNRESRIAIDLGVWSGLVLPCLCLRRLGPKSRRPRVPVCERADGWTSKTASKE